MTLANHIQSASQPELDALASFLINEFEIQEPGATEELKKPAQSASVMSAMAAWAYMQLNAKDQGD